MEVSPSILEFKGNFNKPTTEYLTLTNNSTSPLAFKVKTTAPKLYCVRPNASLVDPGSTVSISIILQGFTKPLPKNYKCKDKFLLVSLPCPGLKDSSRVSNDWAELEDKYKELLVSKKLRVNYIITDDEQEINSVDPNKPVIVKELINDSVSPSKVNHTNGHSENDSVSPSKVNHTNGHSELVAPKPVVSETKNPNLSNDLQKELDNSSVQINDLSEKLDSNEKSERATNISDDSTSSEKVSSKEPVDGISLPFAIILIIIAFIIGWLIF